MGQKHSTRVLSVAQPSRTEHLGEGLPPWLYVVDDRVTLRTSAALDDDGLDLRDLSLEQIGALALFASYLANGATWDDAFALVATRGAATAVNLRQILRRASSTNCAVARRGVA